MILKPEISDFIRSVENRFPPFFTWDHFHVFLFPRQGLICSNYAHLRLLTWFHRGRTVSVHAEDGRNWDVCSMKRRTNKTWTLSDHFCVWVLVFGHNVQTLLLYKLSSLSRCWDLKSTACNTTCIYNWSHRRENRRKCFVFYFCDLCETTLPPSISLLLWFPLRLPSPEEDFPRNSHAFLEAAEWNSSSSFSPLRFFFPSFFFFSSL